MTVVHFYGVWPGNKAGHFRYKPDGSRLRYEGVPARGPLSLYPWDRWHGATDRPEDEGKFWHWHHPTVPITLLLSWDRSADKRHGCAATFIICDHVTPEVGLDLARAAFPRVFERIEKHLGRAPEFAGPAPAG
jgi:hypothetical protein